MDEVVIGCVKGVCSRIEEGVVCINFEVLDDVFHFLGVILRQDGYAVSWFKREVSTVDG